MNSAKYRLIIALMILYHPCLTMAGWTPMDPALHPHLIKDIQVFNSGLILAVGEFGAMSIRESGQWRIMRSADFHINDIHFMDESNAIAVGTTIEDHYADGIVALWNGSEWTKKVEVPETDLINVWGVSTEDFFVTGETGSVYRYVSGSWLELNTGTAVRPMSIWGTASDNVYLAGTIGSYDDRIGVVLYWNGAGWSVSYSKELSELNCVWGFGSSSVYAAGISDGDSPASLVIFRDGATWHEQTGFTSSSAILDIWGIDSNSFYLVGNDGLIIHKTEDTWSMVDSGVSNNLGLVRGTESGSVFILGTPEDTQVFLELQGEEWQLVSEKKQGALYDITGTNPDHIFAVGSYNDSDYTYRENCLVKEWNGTSWVDHKLGPEGRLLSVWAVSESSAIAVGDEGENYHAKGVIAGWDGVTWSILSTDEYDSIFDVWGVTPDEYYAVGENGLFLRWDGTAWSSIQSGISFDLTRIWGSSSTEIYISATTGSHEDDAGLYRWDGTSLTQIYEMQDSRFSNVWANSSDSIQFYSESSRGLVIEWDGIEDTILANVGSATYSSGFTSFFGLDPENLYIVGNLSRNPLQRWDGMAWAEISVPDGLLTSSVWGTSPDNLFCVGTIEYDSYSNSQFIMHYNGHSDPDHLGVRLYISSKFIEAGDGFYVTGYLDNPGPPMEDVPVFFLLDIHGAFYFWPSWSRLSSNGSTGVDFLKMDIPTGSTGVPVFPFFIWPETNKPKMDGLLIYGAMMNPAMDAILGEMATIEWGFYK